MRLPRRRRGGSRLRSLATVIAMVTAGASAPAAFAKLVDVSLEDLVRSADVIVVARVTDLTQENERNLATADVLETIHGTAGTSGRVRFVASHTWAEDYSAARVGEVAMLFLAHSCGPGTLSSRWYSENPPTGDGPDDLSCIAAHGRGRFVREGANDRVGWRLVADHVVYPPALEQALERSSRALLPDGDFRAAIRGALDHRR